MKVQRSGYLIQIDHTGTPAMVEKIANIIDKLDRVLHKKTRNDPNIHAADIGFDFKDDVSHDYETAPPPNNH